jgi:hypothetical protein
MDVDIGSREMGSFPLMLIEAPMVNKHLLAGPGHLAVAAAAGTR